VLVTGHSSLLHVLIAESKGHFDAAECERQLKEETSDA